MHLFRRDRDLLLSIAGVFILLPSLALAMLTDRPVPPEGADFETIAATVQAFYISNFVWIALVGIASGFGAVAMLVLILDRNATSVREALSRALTLVVPYWALGIITGAAVFLGSLALILPGIYIFIKLLVAGPVMVAEQLSNPVAAMRRSWEITKGNSLRIFSFVAIVGITAFFIYVTSATIFGIIIRLAVSADLADTLTTVVDSTLSTLLSVLMICVYASVYRQLNGPNRTSLAREFE